MSKKICYNCKFENVEGSLFCVKCGKELVDEKQQEFHDDSIKKEKIKNRMSMKKKIGLLGLCILAVLIVVSGFVLSSFKVKLKLAMRRNNIEKIVSIIDDTPRDKRTEMNDMVIDYVEMRYKQYVDEKEGVSYEIVLKEFQDIKDSSMKNNTELDKYIKLTEKVNESKTQYALAQEYVNAKDYEKAIIGFDKVVKEDKNNYDVAQEKLSEIKKIYREEKLEKAREEKEKGNYQEAKTILEKGLEILLNDTDLKVELELVTNLLAEKDIQDTIELAGKLAKQKKYSEAIDEIDNCQKRNGKDKNLSSEKDKLLASYKTQVKEDVNQLYEEEKFKEAIKLLEKAKGYMPDDDEIKKLLAEYNSYMPTEISSLEVYDSDDLEIEEYAKDTYENEYVNALIGVGMLDLGGSASYLINGKYNYISGDIAFGGNIDKSESSFYVQIFADEKCVYTSETVNYKTKPVHFDVSLGNDVHELRIVYESAQQDGWASYSVIIGNVSVYNRK